MSTYSRRVFLGRVGSGLLVSAAGLTLAPQWSLEGLLFAAETDRLHFGNLEPLVALMQETAADDLLPVLKTERDKGTSLETMVTAAALANARTFGGQDYTGYHCFMAMVPALAMSRLLPEDEEALPVFKVLHRNARRIQEQGGRTREVLRPVKADEDATGEVRASLLAAGRQGQFMQAEATLASVARQSPEAAYASLQPLIRDNIDVHQVVLAYRSWDMMAMTGPENGNALLRQVLRQCIDRDENRRKRGRAAPAIRKLLPVLMEAQELNRPALGARNLRPSELEQLARLVFTASREEAALAVAEKLGAGVAPDDIGQALSLASVWLLLHDPGRSRGTAGKPEGSVHGASVGLHAADTANAWRGVAAAVHGADANASLITAAWHTAGQSTGMDTALPHHASARSWAAGVPQEKILSALHEALQAGDQKRSCALVERYGKTGGEVEPLMAHLIQPALRHNGSLHHEKYFHTATEEYARTGKAYRWDHLVALARVMASGYGFPSAGFEVAQSVLQDRRTV